MTVRKASATAATLEMAAAAASCHAAPALDVDCIRRVFCCLDDAWDVWRLGDVGRAWRRVRGELTVVDHMARCALVPAAARAGAAPRPPRAASLVHHDATAQTCDADGLLRLLAMPDGAHRAVAEMVPAAAGPDPGLAAEARKLAAMLAALLETEALELHLTDQDRHAVDSPAAPGGALLRVDLPQRPDAHAVAPARTLLRTVVRLPRLVSLDLSALGAPFRGADLAPLTRLTRLVLADMGPPHPILPGHLRGLLACARLAVLHIPDGAALSPSVAAQLAPRVPLAGLYIERAGNNAHTAGLTAFTGLRRLSLGDNFDPSRELTDCGVGAVAQALPLQSLMINAAPHVACTFLNQLGAPTALRELRLHKVGNTKRHRLFDGTKLPGLARCTALTTLSLRDSRVAASVVDVIVALPRLEHLHVVACGLGRRLNVHALARRNDVAARERLVTLACDTQDGGDCDQGWGDDGYVRKQQRQDAVFARFPRLVHLSQHTSSGWSTLSRDREAEA